MSAPNFQVLYEDILRFASEGELREDLHRARVEYVARTGELFDSDPFFERRLAAFLEWYILDRPLEGRGGLTPAEVYVEREAATLDTPHANRLRTMVKTTLSLFEFKKLKENHVVALDLCSNQELSIVERRRPVALSRGDILEARLIPYEDRQLIFSDTLAFCPPEARRLILKGARNFRSLAASSNGDATRKRQDFVHRVAFLTNRCERYKHVSPKVIFKELV